MNDKIIKKLFKTVEKCSRTKDFPVAAIVYNKNKIISCGYNKRNKSNFTTDHAEIIAIQKANKKLHNWNLSNMCMVVTLEPCDMCKRVIKEARLKEVYYIVPRYSSKKQYKCTIFKNYDCRDEIVEKYTNEISSFFKDKR